MLGQNKVVLIIEENDELFEECYDELVDYQFEVTSASDFGEAFNIIEKIGDDLAIIISEFQVDGESFVEFKERMIDEGYSAPCLLVCDTKDRSIKEEISRLKVFKVLKKPLDIEALKEAIEKIEEVA